MNKNTILYIQLWAIPCLCAALYSLGLLGEGGQLAGKDGATAGYILQTIVTLWGIGSIWAATVLKRMGYLWRLLLLLSAALAALLIYYIAQTKSCLYLALIVMLSSLLCLPKKQDKNTPEA